MKGMGIVGQGLFNAALQGQFARRCISNFACSNTISIQKIPVERDKRLPLFSKNGITEAWEHFKLYLATQLRYPSSIMIGFDI